MPTFCFKIDAVLGMRFCEPEQLIAKKRRNRLAAADKAVCYLTRGTFKEDSNDAGFIDTRWVELEELYENCGKTPLKNALRSIERRKRRMWIRRLPTLRRASSTRDTIMNRRI